MSRVDLEDLIGTIYAAAAEPRGWADVLRELTQLISGSCAALHVHSTAGTSFAFDMDYNADPVALAEYAQHYYKINPLMGPLARVPVGATVCDRSLLRWDEFVKCEYYQDYGRRYDMGGSATIVLGGEGAYRSCLGILHRWGAEPFSEEQLALLRRLTPHLQRAIAINRRFDALHAAMDAVAGTLDRLETGVLLLNGFGMVVHANSAAEALLRCKDGLFAVRGKLRAADPAANEALEAAVLDALANRGQRGGFVAITRGEGRRPLPVRVAALPEGHAHLQGASAARAIVFVTVPETEIRQPGTAAAIMAAYGLTAAERRVAEAVAAGDTLKEVAEKLGIANVTARNHLTRAMAKTGTRRQAELVRLLLSSRVPVR